MLSVFAAQRAINEGAGYRYSYVGAYDFGDYDLETSFAIARTGMQESAMDYFQHAASCDTILAEAAIMGNTEKYYVLSESVFSDLKKKIVDFFNKCIAWVKGLIEKLKARFYQFTRQTDKWVNLMKPKIEAKSGMSDVEMEMYNWDSNYVMTGISGAFKTLEDSWSNMVGRDFKTAFTLTKTNLTNRANENDSLAKERKANFTGKGEGKGEDTKVSIIGNNRAQVDTSTKEITKDTEKILKEFWRTQVAEALGVKGSDQSDVLSAMERKAKGGVDEKRTVKYASKINQFVDCIDKAKQTIDDIKEALDKHREALTDLKNDLESEGTDLDTNDGADSDLKAGYQAVLRAYYDKAMKVTSAFEGAMNVVKDRNIKLLWAMVSDYMSAGSHYVAYKPKKD